MDEPARVRGRQRRAHLQRDVDRVGARQHSAIQPLPERLALDVLRHHERPAVEIAEVMDHQDVRVVQR